MLHGEGNAFIKMAFPLAAMVSHCQTLDELWDEVENLNRRHFPDNTLQPILGGGRTRRPKVMFVFINPTGRNISSDKEWQGPRFPFIGTKQVWRVFHRAGLFDDGLMESINNNSTWSLEFTGRVLDFLKRKSFYLTNLVKWTGRDATLPDSEKIRLFLPILEKEIGIVHPRYIVAFGLLPFESIAKRKIKLHEYYSKAMRAKRVIPFEVGIGSRVRNVIPCYFPVGRGNPEQAVDLLRLVDSLE